MQLNENYGRNGQQITHQNNIHSLLYLKKPKTYSMLKLGFDISSVT